MKFYSFGLNEKHDDNQMTGELLGGKGVGLQWMSSLGVNVPPGFTIPTTAWAEYDKNPAATMGKISVMVVGYLKQLEEHFGYMPLLSVRSGARVSCPGMMDTILNVGIDHASQDFWMEKLGANCFGNSLHRLVVMYGSVVKELDRKELEPNLMAALAAYKRRTNEEFPDAFGQLLGSIEAVFKSWDNERADVYRKMNGYERSWGTAVTVQAMVFGNLNDQSGTGVLFTRNPDTGEDVVTGEFLPNAQGEDIVAGIRTPMKLSEMIHKSSDWQNLYHELLKSVKKLEIAKKDVQDIEFTVQDMKMYLLQTRNAKRSATAAVRIAIDMAKSGLIDPKTAAKRVTPKQFDLAQTAQFDPKFKVPDAQMTGIGACSGLVVGVPVFDRKAAIDCKEPCILITEETTPDDIAGMYAAKGVITMVGGLTSHAAVVARSMDRACIVGLGHEHMEALKKAQFVTMDGATGRIWTCSLSIVDGSGSPMVEEFKKLVYDAYGIVPVLQEAPKTKLKEAVFYVGDLKLDPQKAAQEIVKAAGMVTEKLYVDFEVGTEAEKLYFTIFAAAGLDQRTVNALVATDMSNSLMALKKKVVIVGLEAQHPHFKSMGVSSDLRSLVMADGEVMMGGDVNDTAIMKVLQWKQAEGLQFVSLGAYLAGTKSMLSVAQALQLK